MSSRPPASGANEGKLYTGLVWGLVAIGVLVLLFGFTRPIVLLVISAVVGGFTMFLYPGLLILVNRKTLPGPIRIRGVRLGVLVWSILLFGTLSALPFRAQIALRRPTPALLPYGPGVATNCEGPR